VGVTIRGEEYPRAYVALQEAARKGDGSPEGKAVKPADIASWLATKVAPHKRLVGGVKFVDAIPKNQSGKILRKELREVAKKEVGDGEMRESRL
jgi:4-coumarate--CoA ligase